MINDYQRLEYSLISEIIAHIMEPQPVIIEDGSQAGQMRQPKKRFVGRRTADAQAQKGSAAQTDVESTAVQTGIYSPLSWCGKGSFANV